MVNTYDINDIINTMLFLVNDEDLQNNLSKKGLRRSIHFTWKKSAQDVYQLYQEVLKE